MYGGNAVGGVVNSIDGRIAQEGLTKPADGAVEYRYGGANDLSAGGMRLNAGNQSFVLHADAYGTDNRNLRIPGSAWTSTVQNQRGDSGPSGQLPNSQGDSQAYGLGGSVFSTAGYVGVSWSQFNTNYGTVAEPTSRST
jgi:iron complex outermembrane receptor protein